MVAGMAILDRYVGSLALQRTSPDHQSLLSCANKLDKAKVNNKQPFENNTIPTGEQNTPDAKKTHDIAQDSIREVWVSIKFLSAKFGFTPPPPPPKGPKMRKNCTNKYKILKIDTFSGGGGERDFTDKTILWTSGRF